MKQRLLEAVRYFLQSKLAILAISLLLRIVTKRCFIVFGMEIVVVPMRSTTGQPFYWYCADMPCSQSGIVAEKRMTCGFLGVSLVTALKICCMSSWKPCLSISSA